MRKKGSQDDRRARKGAFYFGFWGEFFIIPSIPFLSFSSFRQESRKGKG